MPSILRNVFGAPTPTAPMIVDTHDLAVVSDEQLRARLDDIARQRRELVAEHAARVKPLVEERARLEERIGAIDSKLAWQGIQRTDRGRELDRQVLALQTELHGRVVVGADGVDDDDELPNARQVEKLLNSMLSGKLARNNLIASDATMSEACERYDRLGAEAIAWLRQVAQTRSLTGRTPDMPESVGRFNADLLRDLAQRRGLRL